MKFTHLLIVSIVAMLSLSAISQTNPPGPVDTTALISTTTNVPIGTVVVTNTLPDPGTNAPPVPAPAPETLKPLLDLLGGKGTWITTVIAWFAALSLALAPFAVWIRNKLADQINKAAESSEEDDDRYLRSLLGNPFYKLISFVLNFANIRFPTLAELEHAIKLQQEAAKEALAKAGVKPAVVPIDPKV